jgi:hypothetical protein
MSFSRSSQLLDVDYGLRLALRVHAPLLLCEQVSALSSGDNLLKMSFGLYFLA